MTNDRALLAVSFGTTRPAAIESAIAPTEAAIAEAFPDRRLVRAFSSAIVRSRLFENFGLAVPSPAEALARLSAEGVRDLLVAPLFLIPGAEFERKLLAPIRKLCGAFSSLALSTPLLPGLAEELATLLEMRRRAVDAEADLVLMGHGSEHAADRFYVDFQKIVDRRGWPLHLGTVEGSLGLEAVLSRLTTGCAGEGRDGMAGGKSRGFCRKARRLLLAPLMLVAGEHVEEDLAGPGGGSWLSRLRAAGYEVQLLSGGLGEEPNVRALFVRAACEAVAREGSLSESV